jgi:GTP-binding protein
MENLKAEHLGSGREAKHWPKPTLPEYAFIGRSNVGKSSLVNRLVGIHRLARVSNTPGRTRNVEHFRVEAYKGKGQAWTGWRTCQGYGFAKIAKDGTGALWQVMVRSYLRGRENLQCVFLLIDVRLDPQANDLEMIHWLGAEGIPFVLVFTKCDKLKQPAIMSHVAWYRRTLKRTWKTPPQMILTSAEDGKGREELLHFIADVNSRWAG